MGWGARGGLWHLVLAVLLAVLPCDAAWYGYEIVVQEVIRSNTAAYPKGTLWGVSMAQGTIESEACHACSVAESAEASGGSTETCVSEGGMFYIEDTSFVELLLLSWHKEEEGDRCVNPTSNTCLNNCIIDFNETVVGQRLERDCECYGEYSLRVRYLVSSASDSGVALWLVAVLGALAGLTGFAGGGIAMHLRAKLCHRGRVLPVSTIIEATDSSGLPTERTGTLSGTGTATSSTRILTGTASSSAHDGTRYSTKSAPSTSHTVPSAAAGPSLGPYNTEAAVHNRGGTATSSSSAVTVQNINVDTEVP